MNRGFPESVACPGIEESWSMLAGKDPQAVQVAAGADYVPESATYLVPCLGQTIEVHVATRRLSSPSGVGRVLLERYPEYSKLSVLRYLVHVRDLDLSGELIKPSQLPGGDFFTSGTHVLPLAALARKFDGRLEEFAARGHMLGGVRTEHGDVSMRLHPFPRIPMHVILWSGDEEFPAWATLLVDASCREQLPVDIVWSTAMMCLELLLDDDLDQVL